MGGGVDRPHAIATFRIVQIRLNYNLCGLSVLSIGHRRRPKLLFFLLVSHLYFNAIPI